MTRATRWAAAAGLAATLLLAGCSGPAGVEAEPPAGVDIEAYDPDHPGNGLWLVSGDAAVAEIAEAVRAAGDVTYEGAFTELVVPDDPEAAPSTGRALTVSFAGDPERFRASLAAGDLAVDVVVSDGATYVRGNDAFAERSGVAAARDGYVCLASTAALDDWQPLLDPSRLVAELLRGAEEVSVMVPPADAATTDVVVGGSETPTGTMTVAAVGAPLPQEFVAGDASGDGRFAFAGWGEDVPVSAPADIAQGC
ncbi:hypothetical protein [Microbacterium gilvum]|uniref:Lipoprotein n=1 Tax=Microbacterium gilvum TaxID=1336204 RepID=A0ABP9A0P5_9MICO